jgi:hypothetical protein
VLFAWAVHQLVAGSRESRRRMLRGFCWTIACALVVAGPLLAEYLRSPDAMLPRSGRTLFSTEGLEHSRGIYGVSSASAVVWHQLVRSAGMFHFYASADGGSFLPNRGGFFEPLTAALFLLGFALALFRPRDRRCAWPLLGWTIAMTLEVGTVDPPSYSRAGPAAAMALLLAGLACAATFHAIEHAVETMLGRGIPQSIARGRRVADGFAALAACGAVAWGGSRYFLEYCRKPWLASDSTAVGRRIAAEPADRSFAFLLTAPVFDMNYGTIRFLAPGHRGTTLQPGAPRPELVRGVNLFLALPGRAAELEAFARTFPPGRWEKHYKVGTTDELEMVVLRIVVPEPRKSGP